MKDASQIFNELPDGSEFSGVVSGKSQTTSSVTGVIQAFDDYDEISKTYMMSVCISEDDLQDWMTDGVSITMSPSD